MSLRPLCTLILCVISQYNSTKKRNIKSVPFSTDLAICLDLSPIAAGVPEQKEYDEIDELIAGELETKLLDSLHDHLWFVARPDFRNIDAMHRPSVD